MSFAAAANFGEDLLRIYKELNYDIVKIPTGISAERRARKILIETNLFKRRKATHNDLNELFELHALCFSTVVEAQFGSFDIDWQQQNFLRSTTRPEEITILQEPGSNRIIAIIGVTTRILEFSASPVTFVDRLEVHPDYQNLGLGTILLDELQQDYPNTILGLQVLKMNQDALRLYKRLGYQIQIETDTHFVLTKV
jgi:ribosomal protein S18 acetylase RimI-like enzyme